MTRASRGIWTGLFAAAALLVGAKARTQPSAPPQGAVSLAAPPLAVNPAAPAPPSTQSPFAPFWPSQIQVPGFPPVKVPSLPVLPPFPTVPYWSPSRVLVLPHPSDLVNLKVLADIVQRNLQGGRTCGLREMAPGIFIRLDCRPPEQPVAPTRPVFTQEKLDLLAKGKLHMSRVRPAPAPNQVEPPADGIDHRAEGLEGPVKDQGAVGNCTAFSLSTVMDNAILRMRRSDVMSPLHIWSHYAFPEVTQATTGNINKPIASLAVWPYSPKEACEMAKDPQEECGQAYGVRTNSSSLDPLVQRQFLRAEASGTYRIVGVDQISTRPVNTDALAAVLESGADVWGGMEIDSAAWKVTAANPVIPDYAANEGGHAIALAGYRKTANGRQFLIHNSWGGTWGDHGFAWIGENMVRQHMHYAFKVRVSDPSGNAPPSHTDDECPDHQLVDSETGKCAPMCPLKTRSTNGKC